MASTWATPTVTANTRAILLASLVACDVCETDIRHTTRMPYVVRAREVFAYVCRLHAVPYPEIAAATGHRSHTAIMAQRNRIELRLLAGDEESRRLIERVLQLIPPMPKAQYPCRNTSKKTNFEFFTLSKSSRNFSTATLETPLDGRGTFPKSAPSCASACM